MERMSYKEKQRLEQIKSHQGERGTGRTRAMVMKIPQGAEDFKIIVQHRQEAFYLAQMMRSLRPDLNFSEQNFMFISGDVPQRLKGLRRSQIFVDHAVLEEYGKSDQQIMNIRGLQIALSQMRE